MINVGGVNVLCYGNVCDLCLGLEVVLLNGEIWYGLSWLCKDNMGYDFKNFLIGVEGFLGIIIVVLFKFFVCLLGEGMVLMVVLFVVVVLDFLVIMCGYVGEVVLVFELIYCEGLDFFVEIMFEVC